MGDPKTYFILNSTDYAPNELIELGQVIGNPRLPYRRITAPLRSSAAFPKVHELPKKDWSYEKSKNTSDEVGIFATFFNMMTAKLSGHASENFSQTWKAAFLHTRYIEFGEDATYAKDIIKVQAVQDWLKENKVFGKTVYIVTGVKVATRPGEAIRDSLRESEFDAEVSGDPGTEGIVSLGANAKFDHSAGSLEKGSPSDFVFAYRLRKVNVSWRDKVRLRDDVAGADLHGVGPRKRGFEAVKHDEVVEDEVEEVFLGKSDFGFSLPDEDEKLPAIDEDDDDECLIVVAQEEESLRQEPSTG